MYDRGGVTILVIIQDIRNDFSEMSARKHPPSNFLNTVSDVL